MAGEAAAQPDLGFCLVALRYTRSRSDSMAVGSSLKVRTIVPVATTAPVSGCAISASPSGLNAAFKIVVGRRPRFVTLIPITAGTSIDRVVLKPTTRRGPIEGVPQNVERAGDGARYRSEDRES
jgi:hypothetical protein